MTEKHPVNPFQAPSAIPVAEALPVGSYGPTTHGMAVARTGLQLIYWATACIFIFCFLGFIVIFLTTWSGSAVGVSRGAEYMMLIPFMLMWVLIVVGAITIFVGHCLCIAIPAHTRARSFAVACVAAYVLSVVVSCGGGMVAGTVFQRQAAMTPGDFQSFESMSWIMLAMQIFNFLLSFVALFCYLLFLKKTGSYLQRPDVESHVKNTMMVFGLLIGVGVIIMAFFYLGSFEQEDSMGIGVIFSILVLILGLVALVRYLTSTRVTFRAMSDPIVARPEIKFLD